MHSSRPPLSGIDRDRQARAAFAPGAAEAEADGWLRVASEQFEEPVVAAAAANGPELARAVEGLEDDARVVPEREDSDLGPNLDRVCSKLEETYSLGLS